MFNCVVTEIDHLSLPIKIIQFDLILSQCHRHSLYFSKTHLTAIFNLLHDFQFKTCHLCFTTKILYALLFCRITNHCPALHNLLPTTVPITSGNFSEQYFYTLEISVNSFCNYTRITPRIKQTAKFGVHSSTNALLLI